MKRAIVLLISVAAVVAGCGSAVGAGQGSGSTPAGSTVSATSAAAVLAAAGSSAKHATAVAFDATLAVKVGGNLKGAGEGAALLKGPLKFEFKGHAGLAGADKSKFDITFAFNYLGGSFTGSRSPPTARCCTCNSPRSWAPAGSRCRSRASRTQDRRAPARAAAWPRSRRRGSTPARS